jgi:outer membrane protein OmpA-like peptidoglycan-associated protein
VGLCAGTLAGAPAARADNLGFQVNRYEPTPAGQWSFAVDHPWYSATRYFAVGVTLDYAHNPLVLSSTAADGTPGPNLVLLSHQLSGHLDLATSFLGRVNLSLALPMALWESGDSAAPLVPIGAPTVGDPRLGLMVRLFGQPEQSPISLSLGGYLWLPLRAWTDSLPLHGSDSEVRGLPKLVLAGLTGHLRWSLSTGVLWRPAATLAPLPETAGSELQLGALIQYADLARGFAIGPEFLFSRRLATPSGSPDALASLEVLLGGMYSVAGQVQVGLAAGLGIERDTGTPDARGLFRLAYAPLRRPVRDGDGDGVPDTKDRCPSVAAGPHPDPAQPGCPLRDSDGDGDGVWDPLDACPTEPAGSQPDPARPGCPLRDRDGDGVLDTDDSCPAEPQGPHPDPTRPGCPAADLDSDGVLDAEDACPSEKAGPHPDPHRAGCPDRDSDGDSVFDAVDQCKDVAAGAVADPQRPGCPAADRDHDGVPDAVDVCPDAAGAPAAERSGCPGPTRTDAGTSGLGESIFFDFGKDILLAPNLPLLNAVADLLKAQPQLRRVTIEGHTDSKESPVANRDLSTRRAQSVLRYLVARGVAAARLQAHGLGGAHPVGDNRTVPGRGLNRRVVFKIVASSPAR